jgi:ABC-type amino acid transport substrate-binding protein
VGDTFLHRNATAGLTSPTYGPNVTTAKKSFSLKLAVALCALATASFSHARPLDDVVKSGYIDFAVYEDFKPYSWTDADGKPRGIDVDIATELAKAMGVEPRIHVRIAGENLDADLRGNIWRGDITTKKVLDVMMHVPQDKGLQQLQPGEIEPRNELVHFCCRYQLEQFAVVADPDVLTVNSYAPFVHNKIGVELDTVPDFFLSNAFGGQLMRSIARRPTFEKTIQLWESGEVAGIMATKAQTEWISKNTKRKAKIAQPPTPDIVRRNWPVGLAVRTDSRDLGYEMDLHLETLAKSGRLAEIMSAYGVTYTPVPTN